MGEFGLDFQAEQAGGLAAGHHDYRRCGRGDGRDKPEHDRDEPVQLGHGGASLILRGCCVYGRYLA